MTFTHLTYPTPPEPGTIVAYDSRVPDVRQRYGIVDFTSDAMDAEWTPWPEGISVLRTATDREAYDIALAQNGQEPRSYVEFMMLRRTWTPYGYAKVWGSTPPCAPPHANMPRPRPMSSVKAKKKAIKKVREAYMDRVETANRLYKKDNDPGKDQ